MTVVCLPARKNSQPQIPTQQATLCFLHVAGLSFWPWATHLRLVVRDDASGCTRLFLFPRAAPTLTKCVRLAITCAHLGKGQHKRTRYIHVD